MNRLGDTRGGNPSHTFPTDAFAPLTARLGSFGIHTAKFFLFALSSPEALQCIFMTRIDLDSELGTHHVAQKGQSKEINLE